MPARKWLLEAARIRPLPGRAEKPLRLFRALLRECTYLPDPQARSYLKHHIISRYRAYQPKSSSSEEYVRPLLAERFIHLNKVAKKGLSQLQKANAGYFQPLLKVLMVTYGRVGRRRYDLLEPLKKPGKGTINGSPDIITQKLSQSSTHPSVANDLPKLSSQLEALLTSQQMVGPPTSWTVRAKVRNVELDITTENIWKKPMPQKRIANKVKQWYGEMLYKALPPICEAEWYRLRRLALGEERVDLVLRRRPGLSVEKDDDSLPDTLQLGPELMTELCLAPRRRRVTTSMPHELTPRYLERLWLKVFELCPMMNWNAERKKWHVRWGCIEMRKPKSSVKWANNGRLLEYLNLNEVTDQNDVARNNG